MSRKRKNAAGCIRLIAQSILAVAIGAASAEVTVAAGQRDYEYDYRGSEYARRQYYKANYPEEIFQFCEKLYRYLKLEECLHRQLRFRRNILAVAREKTGSNSLARIIYDDCLEHHPLNGVRRIGTCVDTRLILFERVGDIAVERAIYRKCEAKWRHSGAPAIDVCCAHEGSYYRRHGELRD